MFSVPLFLPPLCGSALLLSGGSSSRIHHQLLRSNRGASGEDTTWRTLLGHGVVGERKVRATFTLWMILILLWLCYSSAGTRDGTLARSVLGTL